ncbi:thioredoxin O1, mitochondrial-like [Hibiscus syriacus]|uniref:thioredoxin O1, mitochondrial-like n=1 Tax=Hibiscus syriacus TaxID=106335 RepID=UPI001921DE7B|nr:thioredoxin O1, mitochondrial-like [Hibiscus syriacus]
MRGRSILRPILFRQAFSVRSISSSSSQISISNLIKLAFLEHELALVPKNVVPVKTEEEFYTAASKIQGQSVPAVLYFTATWCTPCRFIGPLMVELARRTPEVTFYKIDADKEGLAGILEELNVTSVPTIHYFKEGKMEDEVVGADATHIVLTMNRLYNMRRIQSKMYLTKLMLDGNYQAFSQANKGNEGL